MIVVLSEQQLREIRDDFRIGRAEQFVVVPLGIELLPFAEERHAEIVVGIVGRLTEIKSAIAGIMNVPSESET